MNKKAIALTEEQYRKIISTMRTGFLCSHGHVVKANNRIATALSLEVNLGLRIGAILQLRLSSIIRDGDRYRLKIVETDEKYTIYDNKYGGRVRYKNKSQERTDDFIQYVLGNRGRKNWKMETNEND